MGQRVRTLTIPLLTFKVFPVVDTSIPLGMVSGHFLLLVIFYPAILSFYPDVISSPPPISEAGAFLKESIQSLRGAAISAFNNQIASLR